jgi:diamine N-acetyltransferase
MVYDWGHAPDIAPFTHISGEPLEPFAEWCEDWKEYYFADEDPQLARVFVILHDGAPVGAIASNDTSRPDGAELDVWMSSSTNCGKGFGPDAIDALCRYLFSELGVKTVMIQPSARNPRAIRAYEKAGFSRTPATPEEIAEEWGGVDHHDSVLMIRKIDHTTKPSSRRRGRRG